MKTYIPFIFLAAVLAVFSIRHEAIEFGKKSYKFGCDEAALKLEKLGDLAGSQELTTFCEARLKMMNNNLDML
jgi:hypothetical protein